MVLLGLRATAGDPNAAVHFTADGLGAAIALILLTVLAVI
jgi:hypothetical protein